MSKCLLCLLCHAAKCQRAHQSLSCVGWQNPIELSALAHCSTLPAAMLVRRFGWSQSASLIAHDSPMILPVSRSKSICNTEWKGGV